MLMILVVAARSSVGGAGTGSSSSPKPAQAPEPGEVVTLDADPDQPGRRALPPGRDRPAADRRRRRRPTAARRWTRRSTCSAAGRWPRSTTRSSATQLKEELAAPARASATTDEVMGVYFTEFVTQYERSIMRHSRSGPPIRSGRSATPIREACRPPTSTAERRRCSRRAADVGARRPRPSPTTSGDPIQLSREHSRMLQLAFDGFARQATTVFTSSLRTVCTVSLLVGRAAAPTPSTSTRCRRRRT